MKKRFVLAMVLCIALCLAFGGAALASSAGNSFGYVNDAVGLLSLDEQQELETTAAQLAERYGCGVYVIIVDDYTDYTNGSTRDFAKETYINYDLGVGEDKNGILLVLSISDRDYYHRRHTLPDFACRVRHLRRADENGETPDRRNGIHKPRRRGYARHTGSVPLPYRDAQTYTR